jgi:hypothetical protein
MCLLGLKSCKRIAAVDEEWFWSGTGVVPADVGVANVRIVWEICEVWVCCCVAIVGFRADILYMGGQPTVPHSVYGRSTNCTPLSIGEVTQLYPNQYRVG